MVLFILLWNGDIPVICRRCSADVLVVDRNFKSQFMKVPDIHVQRVEKQKGLGWKIQLSQIWHLLLVTFKSWLILSFFFFPAWRICQVQKHGLITSVSLAGRTTCAFFYFSWKTTHASFTQHEHHFSHIIFNVTCSIYEWLRTTVVNASFEHWKGQPFEWKASRSCNVPKQAGIS